MANFFIAYKKTSISEGGWADDPLDAGGQTWKGIARNMHPTWSGWAMVDAHKQEPGFPGNMNGDGLLESAVQKFYHDNFWEPINGDQILFQAVANQIYDSAVNTGPKEAIIQAQEAAFDGQDLHQVGVIVGEMDQKTLNSLNNQA